MVENTNFIISSVNLLSGKSEERNRMIFEIWISTSGDGRFAKTFQIETNRKTRQIKTKYLSEGIKELPGR